MSPSDKVHRTHCKFILIWLHINENVEGFREFQLSIVYVGLSDKCAVGTS